MIRPTPSDPPLTLLPLGGVGRMSMNGMLVGHRGRYVLVDAGARFRTPDGIGYDREVHDLEVLGRWKDQIEAVVLTHGHEDHIGALPWVLDTLDPQVAVWGTPMAVALARHRLEERRPGSSERLQTYGPGQRFQAGPFEVEPLRVTHSIPDCCALALRCDDGLVVHTGDWKIDGEPLDGEHFDRAGFERLGAEGVTALLSDSTNAQVPGRTRGEREVADALLAQVEAWRGRVIVALFASNLYRIQALVEAAEATGRRLAFVGRSLIRYLEEADRLGRAPIAPGKVVTAEHLNDVADERLLVACTGSQGEPQAALARAAQGKHRRLMLGSGDLVIHSARVIPGRTLEVQAMFNGIARLGAQLVRSRGTGVHASGHAKADELRDLIRWVQPKRLVPIHGERTFLEAHAALGAAEGVATTVIEDGTLLGLGDGPGGGRPLRRETLSRWYVDGPAAGDAETMMLSARKRLAWNGVIFASATWPGPIEGSPDHVHVSARAIWWEDDGLEAALETRLREALALVPQGTPESERREVARVSLSQHVRRALDKRPEVVVVFRGHAAEVD